MSLYKNQPHGMRQRRVAEQIQRVLSYALISGKLYLPELDDVYVGIGAVQVSPDLKRAKVFLSAFAGVPLKGICQLFNDKKSSFQALLAQELQLKFVPVLQFLEDTFQEQADRTEELFHNKRVQEDIAKPDDD